MSPWHLREAVRILRGGGIIAYPTEAVYGLGCDPLNPDAVWRLLGLKRRSMEKGLILVASDLDQLRPFLAPLEPHIEERIADTWPGPVTWLLPVREAVPRWLTGAHERIAVRVTAHPLAAALCRAWGGALVSTSANLSGRPAATSPLAVRRIFGDGLDYVLHGPLGGQALPSEIRDAVSGQVVRPG